MASTATKVLGIGCGLLCFLLIVVLGISYYIGSHATTQPAPITPAPALQPPPDDTPARRAKIRETILTAARDAEAGGSYGYAKMILTGVKLGYMKMPSWLANDKEIREVTARLDKEIAKASTDTHSPSNGSADEANPYTMWRLCKENVRARLRAPSTAEFVDDSILDMQSHVFHDLRKHKTANDYLVKGEVDSQNGFGARLRSVYQCSITWTGGERYVVRFTHVFTR